MRKIVWLVALISFVLCGAAYTEEKTVARDKDLIIKSDYYADAVRGVSPETAGSKQAISQGNISIKNDIANKVQDVLIMKTSGTRPGADAVKNIDILETRNVVTFAPGYTDPKDSIIERTFPPRIKDIRDIIKISSDGYITLKDEIDPGYMQGIVKGDGFIMLQTGDNYQTLILDPTRSATYSYIYEGPYSKSHSWKEATGGVYSPKPPVFRDYRAEILTKVDPDPLPTENAANAHVSGSEGATVSTVVTEEIAKKDDAKSVGARNRHNKQRSAVRKLMTGESIIDEE